MIQPRQAPVNPRVVSPETGDTIVLDEAIESLAETMSRGAVEIVGGQGTGKTTALRHLERMCESRVDWILMDEPDPSSVTAYSTYGLVIFTAATHHKSVTETSLSLAPWTDDDLIEYLLTVRASRCASVMRRIQQDDFGFRLQGNPRLWRLVLDQLAADESVMDVRAALRRAVEQILGDKRTKRLAKLFCLAALLSIEDLAASYQRKLITRCDDEEAVLPLRHRTVQILLAAQRVVDALHGNARRDFPKQVLPRELVDEIGRLVKHDKDAIDNLHKLLATEQEEVHPMAASILHAAGQKWRPAIPRYAVLDNAYLSGIQWAKAELSHANLTKADLNNADLAWANLFHAHLSKSRLRRAQLHHATMTCALANDADLSGADLSRVDASFGSFRRSDPSGTSFENAVLEGVNLSQANLIESCFSGAELNRAILIDAQLEDADFSNVNFSSARLDRLPLHKANLIGARFDRASLIQCDLEFVESPGGVFKSADLTGAWLTGSIMPRANFRFAKLRQAGLADIEWEDADLQGADLRGCSFHMGSSRSGLVGSPYPGHGSRTGFYTNDYDEQHYKAPEEIRKANLCGADLRGANVIDVDFYLVDLRGAKYDARQAEHFRRCDAILVDRI